MTHFDCYFCHDRTWGPAIMNKKRQWKCVKKNKWSKKNPKKPPVHQRKNYYIVIYSMSISDIELMWHYQALAHSENVCYGDRVLYATDAWIGWFNQIITKLSSTLPQTGHPCKNLISTLFFNPLFTCMHYLLYTTHVDNQDALTLCNATLCLHIIMSKMSHDLIRKLFRNKAMDILNDSEISGPESLRVLFIVRPFSISSKILRST